MNKGKKTIKKTTLQIAGFREGFSEPLFETDYLGYETDKIIEPEGGFGSCWKVPEKEYGISDSLVKAHPPETLKWELVSVRPDFVH